MTEKKRYRSPFPKTLSACIEPLTRPVLRAQGLPATRLITQWPEIVGAEMAGHCVPEKLSFPPGKNNDGTLTIAVENGFATEIQYMQPAIMERLASYFGYKAVTRITISHTYRASALAQAAVKKPRKPALDKQCIEATHDIDDVELKAAFSSFAHALSSKQ